MTQSFSSIIQILVLETRDTGFKDKVTGEAVMRSDARCILFNDDGSVNTVGRLRVPKPLVPVAKVGTFRGGFAMQVPDWGDNKGDIVAVLTHLQEVPGSAAGKPPAVAVAPQPAKV